MRKADAAQDDPIAAMKERHAEVDRDRRTQAG